MSDQPSPYIDEPEKIPPDSVLVRRVSPDHVDWDGERVDGRLRVSRQAIQLLSPELALKFGCPGPGLSLIALHLSEPLEQLVEKYHVGQGQGLAYLDARMLRGDEGERGIQHRWMADEPGHVVMFRFDGGRKLAKGLQQSLADYATSNWIVEPSPR